MSPRRKLDPAGDDGFRTVVIAPAVRPRWRRRLRVRLRDGWRFPAAGLLAALVVVAAATGTALMLRSHVQDRQSEIEDATVLSYVQQFMTDYTSLDPDRANDYADRILAHATGDFAKDFKARQNVTVIQVARGEPRVGTVISAGIERRHDDGSISVLVAAKFSMTGADPKLRIESGSRWVVTVVREGQQLKISRLNQVI